MILAPDMRVNMRTTSCSGTSSSVREMRLDPPLPEVKAEPGGISTSSFSPPAAALVEAAGVAMTGMSGLGMADSSGVAMMGISGLGMVEAAGVAIMGMSGVGMVEAAAGGGMARVLDSSPGSRGNAGADAWATRRPSRCPSPAAAGARQTVASTIPATPMTTRNLLFMHVPSSAVARSPSSRSVGLIGQHPVVAHRRVCDRPIPAEKGRVTPRHVRPARQIDPALR